MNHEKITETDAKPVTVTRIYDALDRLTSIDYPAPSLDTTFNYDAAGAAFSKSFRKSSRGRPPGHRAVFSSLTAEAAGDGSGMRMSHLLARGQTTVSVCLLSNHRRAPWFVYDPP